MAITLYPSKSREDGFKLPLEDSFNYLLVKDGHAKFVEEPFLSKENHERREELASRSDSYVAGPNTDDHQAWIDKIQIPEPSATEYIRTWHKLFGPFSPLEMTPYPITRKCAGKSVGVEMNSINSILINENPVDTTTRMIIAGTVSQNQHTASLTLRNTTLMPAIRGASGILTLLFAPKTELRVDQKMIHFTGALCGLGCDEDGISYDQDNDVEIAFDCKFDLEDIEKINKLRFWMERLLCRSFSSTDDHSATQQGVVDAQKKCIRYVIDLFSKEREPLSLTYFSSKYEWNQVPQEYLMVPSKIIKPEVAVYQLISGVALDTPSPEEEKSKLVRHLAKIQSIVNGVQQMKEPITCMVCQIHIENARSLDFHVKTRYHQMRVDVALNKPFEKADVLTDDYRVQRRLRANRQ